jgi:hypothetical protein
VRIKTRCLASLSFYAAARATFFCRFVKKTVLSGW